MTAQELRALLSPYGIDPIKDRGQHFLLDETVVTDALAAADIGPGDRVLEVGPGPGILTKALLDAGASVVAVDIDRRFGPLLEERFKGRDFTLIIADVMGKTFFDFLDSRLRGNDSARGDDHSSFKVVANLPYGITSEFVVKCLLEGPAPSSTTLLIQKEVAQRIAAGAGEMNRLAALVQAFAKVRLVRQVKPGAFMPPPRVDSTVIHILRKTTAEIEDFFSGFTVTEYQRLLQTAFSAPRKQLKNTVKSLFSHVPGGVDEVLRTAGVPDRARPEEVPVEMWKTLASRLTS